MVSSLLDLVLSPQVYLCLVLLFVAGCPSGVSVWGMVLLRLSVWKQGLKATGLKVVTSGVLMCVEVTRTVAIICAINHFNLVHARHHGTAASSCRSHKYIALAATSGYHRCNEPVTSPLRCSDWYHSTVRTDLRCGSVSDDWLDHHVSL